MTIKSFFSLRGEFRADSSYDNARFETKKTLEYKMVGGNERIVIPAGTEGHLVTYSENKTKGRTGNTITYLAIIDFGDGLKVTFDAESFYSKSKGVKSWTRKDFQPKESISIDGSNYKLQNDPEKIGLSYTFERSSIAQN